VVLLGTNGKYIKNIINNHEEIVMNTHIQKIVPPTPLSLSPSLYAPPQKV
jgi:hypothetical protein